MTERVTLGRLRSMEAAYRATGNSGCTPHLIVQDLIDAHAEIADLRAQLASVPLRGGPTYVPALCAAVVYWAQEGDARLCGKPAVALRDGAYYCEEHK